MANETKQDGKKGATINVNASTVIGSHYSQLVKVTVTDVDITIDFAFVHPQDKVGQVVSRVTLPRKVGEELATIIANTVKQHEANKRN